MPYLDVVIDLSHHNEVSSFHGVKNSGIQAVIHKATAGAAFVDPRLEDSRVRCAAAGLKFGCYHWITANAAAEVQLDHFLFHVKPGELMAVDWEDAPVNLGGTALAVGTEEFVRLVIERTGVPPLLYSGSVFLWDRMWFVKPHDSFLHRCPLWLARYPAATKHVNLDYLVPNILKLRPKVPQGWTRWHLWQYTSCGQVPGIVGNVDRSAFKGTQAEFDSMWEKHSR